MAKVEEKQQPEVSDEDIASYWRGEKKDFNGAWLGAVNFMHHLHTEKNIDVPLKRITRVLHSIPDYAVTTRRIFSFPRQNYNAVRSFFAVVQMDTLKMYNDHGWNYIAILVDVMSSKLFAKPLKSTGGAETLGAFRSILAEAKEVPEVLETDAGQLSKSWLIYYRL